MNWVALVFTLSSVLGLLWAASRPHPENWWRR